MLNDDNDPGGCIDVAVIVTVVILLLFLIGIVQVIFTQGG